MALTPNELVKLDYVIAAVPTNETVQFLQSIRGNDAIARQAIADYISNTIPKLQAIIDQANITILGAKAHMDLLTA